MSFLAQLVSDNSGKILSWGQSVRILVRGYLRVRFDFPGSINFRDISGFPTPEAHNLY